MRRWEVIIDLIKTNKYRRIAEVGVAKGETAIPVQEACDLDVYYLIDPNLGRDFLHHLKEKGKELACFKLLPTTSLEAAPFVPNDLDLVYVDALHDENNVSQDCQVWGPKVRPGGIICGHDHGSTRFPGVKRAVDRIFGEGKIETVLVKRCSIWIYRVPEPMAQRNMRTFIIQKVMDREVVPHYEGCRDLQDMLIQRIQTVALDRLKQEDPEGRYKDLMYSLTYCPYSVGEGRYMFQWQGEETNYHMVRRYIEQAIDIVLN